MIGTLCLSQGTSKETSRTTSSCSTFQFTRTLLHQHHSLESMTNWKNLTVYVWVLNLGGHLLLTHLIIWELNSEQIMTAERNYIKLTPRSLQSKCETDQQSLRRSLFYGPGLNRTVLSHILQNGTGSKCVLPAPKYCIDTI